MDPSAFLNYLQQSYPNRNKLQVFDLQDITSGWETEIFSVSLGKGANELGMREGAVVKMKESVNHIRGVHDRHGELTNIFIPEVEQLIERLS